MNSTNYITPFWVQDVSGSSWNLYLYARNSGSTHGALDWTIDVEYSTDGSTWSDFGTTPTTRNSNIHKSFSANRKVYLRSKTQCTHWGKYDTSNNKFWFIQILSSQHYSVGGNIMSLIYGSTFTDISPVTNEPNYKTFPDDTLKGIFFGLFYSGGTTSNTNLIDASELVLPVTHSTSTIPSSFSQDAPLNRCYASMFNRCTALVRGPFISIRPRGTNDLPYCLQTMFNYCTSLQSVSTCLSGGAYRYDSCFGNGGGAQGGTFYNYSGYYLAGINPRMTNIDVISMYIGFDRVVDWHSDYSGRVYQVTDNNSKVIYKIQGYDSSFYVKNLDNTAHDLFIKINSSYEPVYLRHNYYYSTDNVNWTFIGRSTYASPLTVSVPANTTYYLKSDCTNGRLSSTDQYGATGPDTQIYSTSGKWSIGGNIMSLAYGGLNNWNEQTSFSYPGVLENLFAGWTTLVDARDLILPATTLTVAAYQAMFSNCTSLQSAPVLVEATTEKFTYSDMFVDCLALTELWCYSNVNVNNIKGILSIWNPTPGVVHCINPAVWTDPYEHILPPNWTAVQI